MSLPLISVIIPTFNEEGNVKVAYEAVRTLFENLKTRYQFEIIFTDNHSTDKTFSEISEIANLDNRVKAARFTRNFGFNKSILTGYRLSNGNAAIQMDCDLQDSPEVFLEFLRLWEEGHDVVVGIRKVRIESFLLRWTRKLYYRVLSSLTEDLLILDGGDFRLVDKSIVNLLKEIHDSKPYVRGLVSSLAKNQIGVPYVRQNRKKGKSKFPFFRLLELAIDGIVSHSTIPLRLASLLGMIVGIAMMLLAGTYIAGKLIFGMSWPAGFTTQVILILFGISLNAIFLGIIGEYLARIYHQVRPQPLTIIKEKINLQ